MYSASQLGQLKGIGSDLLIVQKGKVAASNYEIGDGAYVAPSPTSAVSEVSHSAAKTADRLAPRLWDIGKLVRSMTSCYFGTKSCPNAPTTKPWR